MTDASTALGVRLYPDLVELGGLASALALAATRCQLDVGRISAPEQGRGRFTCAELRSERGTIDVGLGSQARYFMVDISGADGCRADGDTTDLEQVVRIADAWRGGSSLGELRARFPFLDHVVEPVGCGGWSSAAGPTSGRASAPSTSGWPSWRGRRSSGR